MTFMQVEEANRTTCTLPERVRVSYGSAVILGLGTGILNAKPTTAYLLTYTPKKCIANCRFCPQAMNSTAKADLLSRVTWPVFPSHKVISRIKYAAANALIKRVCIQAINYPEMLKDVLGLVQEIRSRTDVPISVSCQPLAKTEIKLLAQAGIDRIGIPLDAATKEIFNRVKGFEANGPYTWEGHFEALKAAVDVLKAGRVSTHLIVGLGETEKDLVKVIQQLVSIGVYPGLFAFTPIPGTYLENHPPPSIERYRRIQIARYLIVNGKSQFNNMVFDEHETIRDFGVSETELKQLIKTGEPFITSGCPHCNRPFYNERPTGPIYNYPEKPSPNQIAEIEMQLYGSNGG
jgi:biotin synthase